MILFLSRTEAEGSKEPAMAMKGGQFLRHGGLFESTYPWKRSLRLSRSILILGFHFLQ